MKEFNEIIAKAEISGIEVEAFQVLKLVQEAKGDWREVWQEIVTLGLFDHLYSASTKYEAFIYKDVFFEHKLVDGVHKWDMFTQHGQLFVDWILDHPPFECCVPIADLFRYAQNIEDEFSPWILFEHIAGYRNEEVDGRLLNIGGNDATFLGRALEVWGEYADVVDPYIQLINHYADE